MAIDLTRSDLRLLAVRAAEARDNAEALCDRARQLREQNTSALGSRLRRLTGIADNGDVVSDERTNELARLSQLVGRDPTIELAKDHLRRRYGVTGAQAFELLRHISRTRNCKLRDVARGVAASAAVADTVTRTSPPNPRRSAAGWPHRAR